MPTNPVDQVVARLREALRPIDDDGQSHGGPDGWHPTAEEIGEWEDSFREASNPSAIRTLLDAFDADRAENERAQEARRQAQAETGTETMRTLPSTPPSLPLPLRLEVREMSTRTDWGYFGSAE